MERNHALICTVFVYHVMRVETALGVVYFSAEFRMAPTPKVLHGGTVLLRFVDRRRRRLRST
ncbi:hypothetical protein M404DRAFT_993172 [Pisolithus tinctorius Marx 270]|uniref:Uncharacterized protein n=1 Tax=Pisolithus tinctorius Marx 270 TaxID=870435 RepID=A0A0C3PWB5_PISTI|nr:hypothetical protein M404DRAFT_993172 [Pisolithus tinctorius Marx 270]